MEVLDQVFKKEQFKDNSQRAKNVIYAFYGICIVNLIAIVSDYMQISLLKDYNAGILVEDSKAESNDFRQMIIGLLQSVLFITTAILFLVWFYRAYRNLHVTLGQKRMSYGKNMSVWGFLIPIMSLFVPYQITKEITTKNQRLLHKIFPDFKNITSYTLIGFWWATFIITNFVENFAFRTIFKTDTIDELITSTQAYLVTDILDIIASVLAILLVMQVSKEENLLFENFHLYTPRH